MIRIVIADDHTLLLEGLSEALDAIPDISVVARAQDGETAILALGKHDPDVLLLDIEMPGLGGLAVLGHVDTPPPTIVVTMHTEPEYRRRAAKAGAVGFLSKSTPLPNLAAAIRAAAAGEVFLDEDDPTAVFDRHREPVLDEGAAALTNREKEVLRMLASGVSSTEDLAARLFISQKTVKNHLASVYEKLAITDRAQAVVEAIRLGFHR